MPNYDHNETSVQLRWEVVTTTLLGTGSGKLEYLSKINPDSLGVSRIIVWRPREERFSFH